MRLKPIWRLIPGAALILLTAGSSMALTLGRAQGLALIGRPLDVTVQARLDAGASRDDLCPLVQVYYGETRIDSRVVDLVPGPAPDVTNIRVRVGTPVNEAFVTVYLEVGCATTKLSRRFVLLTEQPGDVAQAAMQPTPVAPAIDSRAAIAAPTQSSSGVLEIQPLPPAAPLEAPAPRAVTEPAAAPAPAAVAQPAQPAPQARPRPATRPAAPRAAAPRPAPRPAPPAQVVERPRLRLDAPQVRLNNTPAARPAVPAPQAALPASAPAAAAAAAAAATASASASASAPAATASAPSGQDEMQRSLERMQALEADIRSMRDLMVRNNTAVTELRARLEQAERERYSNPLVYALLALFAASSALAGLFWHRSRKAQAAQQEWWANNAGRGPAPEPAGAGMAASAYAPQDSGASLDGKTAGAVGALAATAAAMASQPAVSADTAVSGASPAAPARPFEPSGSDGLDVSDVEPVPVDDVSRVQQQADVFASQGDYDGAIGVLRAHIDAHPQGSAAPWMQLMTLLHGLGRRDDFEQVRRDYEWLFSAKVDAFERFGLGDAAADAPSADEQPMQLDIPGPATQPLAAEAPVIEDAHASLDLNLDDLLKIPEDSAPAQEPPSTVASADNNLLDFDFELDPKPQPKDK